MYDSFLAGHLNIVMMCGSWLDSLYGIKRNSCVIFYQTGPDSYN